MRAFVISAPGRAAVEEVAEPVAQPGQVVVDVERVGLCGTDVEFFTGEMAYLSDGSARYPMRIGHEWSGAIASVGDGVDPSLVGRRTTGDTQLGCGRCVRCRSGRQHVCADRTEIGIRGGFPGALAERMVVPAACLHLLPDTVDAVAGALVEPGGNAIRAVQAAAIGPGARLLILGSGTIGLLAALFAQADGAEVHIVGRSPHSLELGRSLGIAGVWTEADQPRLAFDAVIDASNAPDMPARALDLVEPGMRVVYIGLAGTESLIDTRRLVLGDVTAVGILSASPGLAGTIERYASGVIDPRPLVAATVGLGDVASILGGSRPAGAGAGPKFHVDPRLSP